MIRLVLTIGVLIFSSSSAIAKWTGSGTINQVYSHNGFHIIQTSIAENPCGTNGKFYWPTSDDDAKDMLSISLAALMAQKKVNVVFDENLPTCLWGGTLSTHISISKD